jgi:hypothetical protein
MRSDVDSLGRRKRRGMTNTTKWGALSQRKREMRREEIRKEPSKATRSRKKLRNVRPKKNKNSVRQCEGRIYMKKDAGISVLGY